MPYQEAGCATLSFYDAEGERLDTRYLGRMPEPKKATLKTMLSAELDAALGRRPDLCVVKVADGARDNWSYLDALAPQGTSVVDFYHGAEQLKAALDAGYPTPALIEKRSDRRVLVNNCRFEFKIASHQMIRTQNSKHGNLIYVTSLTERQRIVRLLVREVQVGKDAITICHSIPIESAPPNGSGPSRNEPREPASGHGALLVPRCRQVIEQHIEARLEQHLPALAKKREEGAFVGQQLVQASVQGVIGQHANRTAQQVAHGAMCIPVAMQTPFTAGVDELIAHLRVQDLEPLRALPTRGQSVTPKPVELQLLPQRERQPTRAPLTRMMEP